MPNTEEGQGSGVGNIERLEIEEIEKESKPRKQWTPRQILAFTLFLLLLIAGGAAALGIFLTGMMLSIYIMAPLAFVVLMVGIGLAISHARSSGEAFPVLHPTGTPSHSSSHSSKSGTHSRRSTLDPLITITLFGAEKSGKTALSKVAIRQEFPSTYNSTVGVDFFLKRPTKDMPKLHIWDTAGQEIFHSIGGAYLRGVHAVMICYDITDPGSFEKAKAKVTWVKEQNPNVPIMLVGCKADLSDAKEGEAVPRVVSKKEAQQYATEQDLLFAETSAKTGVGVDEAFIALAQAAKAKLESPSVSRTPSSSEKTAGKIR